MALLNRLKRFRKPLGIWLRSNHPQLYHKLIRIPLINKLRLGQIMRLHVDGMFVISDTHVLICGWFRSPMTPVTRIIAIAPDGEHITLTDHCYRYPRTDLARQYGPFRMLNMQDEGFFCLFSSKRPQKTTQPWVMRVQNATLTKTAIALPLSYEPWKTRDAILDALVGEPGTFDTTVFQHHIHPAFEQLQQQMHAGFRIKRVLQYGRPNATPDVSLIIVLDASVDGNAQIDQIQHQSVQFARDPAIQQSDIIYVLNIGQHSEMLAQYSRMFADLYQLPFRVVTLSQPVETSTARMIGIMLARGRLLFWLSAHMLPVTTGWLAAMVAFYDATPTIGVLGAKLLYEDESLHHAGLFFSPLSDTVAIHHWEIKTSFQGLHRNLPRANIARQVPAIGTDCFMVAQKRYQEAGRSKTLYCTDEGDGIDLCLRLQTLGYTHWYYPDVVLYYLNDQIKPIQPNHRTYTEWLLSQTFAHEIATVMHNLEPTSTT
ncbi:MAG: glycosyltransferase [Chloroflexaceae bacterium]|nr:glycosyltransferase [Chloroflexaceae bacterium]